MSIEGIPNGWELVRIGQAMPGDHWIGGDGRIDKWEFSYHSAFKNYVIIRKIEKPKQYRAFANGAEFRPHKERWILRAYKDWIDGDGEYRIAGFDDDGVWSHPTEFCSYQQMLDDDRRFDDGTPFGIEVTE